MSHFNQIAAFIAIASLSTGCADDQDLNPGDRFQMPASSTILSQIADRDSGFDSEVSLLLDETEQAPLVKENSLMVELAKAGQVTESLINSNADPRVLDPEDIDWDNDDRVEPEHIFAFAPDGIDEFIRSNRSDSENRVGDQEYPKDIDDAELWDTDEIEVDEDKFDHDDQYDETEGEEDE